jgi:hypothetical protein
MPFMLDNGVTGHGYQAANGLVKAGKELRWQNIPEKKEAPESRFAFRGFPLPDCGGVRCSCEAY